ncbi:MAG: hypothetical protein Q9168_008168 [Polycauliona sp. 1 TL-2023]
MDVLNQSSRLVSLPTEILKRIVELAIGGQILHVSLKHEAKHEQRCWKDDCPEFKGPGFYISPCVARISEEQAWEDFQKTKSSHDRPQGPNAEYYVPKPCIRHAECKFWPTFAEFLRSISERSKRTIRNIDLDVIFHHEPKDPFDPVKSFYNEDIDIIDLDDLMALSDLEHLNLSVSSSMMTPLGFQSSAEEWWYNEPLNLHETFGRDALRIRSLNIKRLNVVVYDDVEDEHYEEKWPWFRRFRSENQELADDIHYMLTNHESRQVLSARDLQLHEARKLIRDVGVTQTRELAADSREVHQRKTATVASGAVAQTIVDHSGSR